VAGSGASEDLVGGLELSGTSVNLLVAADSLVDPKSLDLGCR
jgi:hypothetical protein